MKATFGAGCFWGVERDFRKLEGVTNTRVGYAGGIKDNPTYEEVCSGKTGHAEVCEFEYNPDEISYEDLLAAFWKMHDPTQLNRQGPDHGTQYRSIIITHSPEQRAAALQSRHKENERLGGGITTVIQPAREFWPAESYHQCYLEKRDKGGFLEKLYL